MVLKENKKNNIIFWVGKTHIRIQIPFHELTLSRSRREVRRRVPFFSVVHFSRGTESPNRTGGEKGHDPGGPSDIKIALETRSGPPNTWHGSLPLERLVVW